VQYGPLGPENVVRLAFVVARRMVSLEQAHDIAQDTWIKYQGQRVKEGPDWPESRARAWVWSVAGNAARSELRKKPQRPLERYLFDLPGDSADPAVLLAEREEGERRKHFAWKILAGLPRRDRDLLTLRNFETRSWREIATILQENERTLRSRYSRLLSRLKENVVYSPTGEDTEESNV
jgi:RNA polymerase sigma factor (sigma-70 family)